MDKQKSSLGFNGYKRIDGYFQNHYQELTTANKDVYDSVDKFRANFTHFEFALSELTEEQKLDAWLQLYNKAVRVIKNNEDDLNRKIASEKPIKKEKFKLNFIHVMMFSLIAAFCIGFGIYNSRTYTPPDDWKAIKQKECVRTGIEYYKSIGAYPKLTSENISAEDKAKQMCGNTVNAFGSYTNAN
ncbi:hypothetical protein [Acinetobacter sp. ANC 4640]